MNELIKTLLVYFEGNKMMLGSKDAWRIASCFALPQSWHYEVRINKICIYRKKCLFLYIAR